MSTYADRKQAARLQRKVDLDELAKVTKLQINPRKKLASTRPFILPKSSQQQSSFTQLPNEVKDMIFDLLLKSKDPLQKSTPFPNLTPPFQPGWLVPDPLPQTFEFDAQVLSVCQEWYHEYAPILHDQNTISIDLVPDAYLQSPLIIIMGRIYQPDSLGQYSMRDVQGNDLPEGIRAYKKFHIRLYHRGNMNPALASPMYQPAALYRNIPAFSRALLFLLLNKDVTFEVSNRQEWSTADIEAMRSHLNTLRLLRCRSFNISSNREDSLVMPFILASIKREVESTSPPVDLPSLLEGAEDFLSKFQTRFLPVAGSVDGQKLRAERRRLVERVEEWDVEGFKEVRKGLMELADRKMGELQRLREVADECMPGV